MTVASEDQSVLPGPTAQQREFSPMKPLHSLHHRNDSESQKVSGPDWCIATKIFSEACTTLSKTKILLTLLDLTMVHEIRFEQIIKINILINEFSLTQIRGLILTIKLTIYNKQIGTQT